MPFEPTKATPEVMTMIRDIEQAHHDKSIDSLVRQFKEAFPSFTERSLWDMFRYMRGISEPAFQLWCEGKIPYSFLTEACSLPHGVQKLLAEEAAARGLQTKHFQRFRHHHKEGMGFAEALARATGEGHKIDQRREHKARSFESILDDVAKLGAKWRALISMAMEASTTLEHSNGVTLDIFEKVYMLRHLIGEQYEFVDQKVKRFLTAIKRRAANGGSSAPEGAVTATVEEEGEGV